MPKTTYNLTISPNPCQSHAPDYTALTVSGTAPRKAEVYLRFTKDGAVEAEWTALHNVRGVVGPNDPVAKVLFPGQYVAQLIDRLTSNLQTGELNIFAETTLEVTV